jgi:hypothetical protein
LGYPPSSSVCSPRRGPAQQPTAHTPQRRAAAPVRQLTSTEATAVTDVRQTTALRHPHRLNLADERQSASVMAMLCLNYIWQGRAYPPSTTLNIASRTARIVSRFEAHVV